MSAANCAACSKPEGTGTLLDFSPRPTLAGFSLSVWQDFAARYSCPACAAARKAAA